jgi:hypothetical protein
VGEDVREVFDQKELLFGYAATRLVFMSRCVILRGERESRERSSTSQERGELIRK